MNAIARYELTQMLRNRAVLVAGLAVPLAVTAVLVWKHETFAEFGSLGYVAATVVTTLAARRQNLFLKRLRSTAARDSAILTGLVLPATALALVQLLGMLAVLSAVAAPPEDLLLFAAAVLATVAMMLGFGLATAGVTNSPEHAQVTTLPLSLGAIAVSVWVGIAGTSELTLLKRLLPGGSAAELMVDSWNGAGRLSDSLLLLAPTLAWVVVALALATQLFRWEPRR